MSERLAQILLVEDNPGDVELTLLAFEESDFNCNISVVRDGEQALEYVYKQGEYVDESRPDVILLDINLPVKNGFEVLERIKSDAELRTIPVLMLTTSDTEKDIYKAYMNYANAYLNKPVDFHEFADLVRQINEFWFTTVKLLK